jgi:hypothetical protein
MGQLISSVPMLGLNPFCEICGFRFRNLRLEISNLHLKRRPWVKRETTDCTDDQGMSEVHWKLVVPFCNPELLQLLNSFPPWAANIS